ncbi:MAG: substrate-binding domain-containing protein [Thermoflexales bacterium]|nr:substrate-binding domain-containing protein [Thermoflexales bacterium]
MADAADANLLYFSSSPIRSTLYFEVQANILYEMVNAANVDGILIASNLIGLYTSAAELEVFFSRYRPLPMVSMGVALETVPSVVLDNFTGMSAVVRHLLEEHHYRRIAFLGGIREHPEAQERYRAFTTTLQDYGIPSDPGLVTFGDFQYASGVRAIQHWLDERQFRPHHDIEAIVVSNDYMAIGVISELQARGLQVPADIAVVGFDDIAVSRSFTPPLTTVRQPLYKIGQQATELLLAQMAGQSIPELTRVAAEVVVRQSCGCAAPDTHQTAVSNLSNKTPKSLQESSQHFFHQLNQALFTNEGDINEGDMTIWNEALTLLRDEQSQSQPDAGQIAADSPEAQICVILRKAILQSLQEKADAQIFQRLGQRLLSTLNIADLMDALAEDLPRLGIRSAYLSLYQDPPAYEFPQPVPQWSRLILAYNSQGRSVLPPEGLRFPTQELLPQDFCMFAEARGMVVEPLYFQREQIGFALFEIGAKDDVAYEILRRYLSNTLQGALLVQRVQEHAAEIARQKYILDMFMASVPDSIYFKDRKSRFTHVNAALAQRFAAQPADLLGKSDFDFFPKALAQQKYADEQEIIQTGQPVLNLEEPDAGGTWALTTKMPLRDEHGSIIGTFGISRDITVLKQAEAEIRALNKKLQAENLRMEAELDVTRRLQQMLLPTDEELRQIEGMDIAGFMQPAEEVGGDYYDVLPHNGAIKISIGDVTGHGLESGVVMLMLQTALRTLQILDVQDPARFIDTLNRLLRANLQRMKVDKSATLAVLDYHMGRMRLSGQHEQVIVVRKGGRVELLDTLELGFPLGLEVGIADFVRDIAIDLQSGDGVVLYSDGITEAQNEAGEFYGLERLCQVVSAHWDNPAQPIKDAVVADVQEFVRNGKVYDDITLLIVKQKSG